MNSSGNCQIGDCNLIDPISCTSLFVVSNGSQEHMKVDSDGCSPHQSTAEFYQFRQFSMLMGVITIVTGTCGVLGNSISVFVFMSKDMRNCFYNLMIALNISDSIHIIFAILDVIKTDFPETYKTFIHPDVFTFIHYPFYRISMCSSIYLIIAVAVERFIAVCKPHHYREVQGKPSRVLLYILPAVLGAVIINITKFFEVTFTEHCEDFTHCGCEPILSKYHTLTPLRLNKNYIIYFHLWTWIFLTGILPFSVLALINSKIYFSIKRLKTSLRKNSPSPKNRVSIEGNLVRNESKRNRRLSKTCKECNLATVLLCTVLTFLMLHLPRILTSLYEAATNSYKEKCEEKNLFYQPIWFTYTIVVINFFLVVNSASNFFIYIFTGEHFKKKFLKIIFGETRSLLLTRNVEISNGKMIPEEIELQNRNM